MGRGNTMKMISHGIYWVMVWESMGYNGVIVQLTNSQAGVKRLGCAAGISWNNHCTIIIVTCDQFHDVQGGGCIGL
jgi:protein tyrosine phosphatase